MATHPGIPAWRIPWTEEPGGLQSMGSHRILMRLSRHALTYVCVYTYIYIYIYIVILSLVFSPPSGILVTLYALDHLILSCWSQIIFLKYFLFVLLDNSFWFAFILTFFYRLQYTFKPIWEFKKNVCVCVWQLLSHVRLFVIPWAVACQAPLSMGFSRQEYWSGWPFPFPGDLPDPAIKLGSHIVGRFFFLLFIYLFISWRLITLQYCSGFCHTLKWISHGFTCVPHTDPPSHLPLHPIPLGLPSAPGLSTCLMHPTWAGDLFHYR